jgi:FK506-binding protein 4/5
MVEDKSVGIDCTLHQDGGIIKEILREGEGEEKPMAGDTVFVHYVGTLEADGSKFDSSRDRDEKFSFQVGQGQVIKGWDEGIPTMKRNELARFTLTPTYGYGNTGSPPKIPKSATLIFEVELFDWQGEDLSDEKDGSIVKRTFTVGSGYTTPNEGSRVVINLKVTDAGDDTKVYDKRDKLEFELGEAIDCNIPSSVETALLKFKQEEKSVLKLKSHKAWSCCGNKQLGIPGGSDLKYEIELLSFEKAKEAWQLNGKEKLEQSELNKSKGAEFFKAGKYPSAIKKYNKVLEFLNGETFDLEEETAMSKKLQLATHLNLALCELKTKEFRKAIKSCEKALELDAQNEKAMFRTASAYFGLSEFSDVVKWAQKTMEVNKDNKEAAQLVASSKKEILAFKNKEKALYGKMFK